MIRELMPRAFQADASRFYTRVVVPALGELPSDEDDQPRIFDTQEAFLEGAERRTASLLAFEARRCFALTLHGVFERQLRIWARAWAEPGQWRKLSSLEFETLLNETSVNRGIDLTTRDLGRALLELHLLANVVRHGDGKSTVKKAIAPHFWSGLDATSVGELEGAYLLSERIRPSDKDILRYARAIVRFWGLADKEWGGVVDAPY
ncbi:hypothetical protein J2R96_005843 [Bradyrhizobium elkanii]|nr:hypothetical protein [Bradyrhizobium elkanii]